MAKITAPKPRSWYKDIDNYCIYLEDIIKVEEICLNEDGRPLNFTIHTEKERYLIPFGSNYEVNNEYQNLAQYLRTK